MGTESDRMARAGRYVLGRMDEAERERAERDLEFDTKFRAAVVAVAERMHLFDATEIEPAADWHAVAGAIAGMPHMGHSKLTLVPPAPSPELTERQTLIRDRAEKTSHLEAAARLRLIVAGCIAAAFLMGYLLGYWRAG